MDFSLFIFLLEMALVGYFSYVAINYYKKRLPKLIGANKKIEHLTSCQNGYFDNHKKVQWKEEFDYLHNDLELYEYILFTGLFPTFKIYCHNVKNIDKIREEYNEKLIKKDTIEYAYIFNDVNGISLDNQQRRAIVTDEDNNLVIAAAGSGKTTTIVGKVRYLIEKYGIETKDFLLISFTNKSAKSLKDKLGIDDIEVKTFNKFGLDVLRQLDENLAIYDSNNYENLLANIFEELCNDEEYLNKVVTFFTDYLKEYVEETEFDTRGDYINQMKDTNFKPYKLNPFGMRLTMKSMQEVKIANFLTFNSIAWEYEKNYPTHPRYKCDFYLPKYKIWIEHFGIDADSNAPSSWASPTRPYEEVNRTYNESIIWKRNLHKNNGSTLVESYSFEFNNGVVFDNLKQNLEQLSVVFSPLSDEEKWKIIKETANDEVKGKIKLTATFLTLLKSNNITLGNLWKSITELENGFEKNRAILYYEIFSPIFEQYQSKLNSVPIELDFNDMINYAANNIESKRITLNYKYIIVDEFQDMSMGRYRLMKAVRDQNLTSKTYCVGDDWQSIYRFTGSDITLFDKFEDYFGVTAKTKIETTYRFAEPLISKTSNFIIKNPNQSKKIIKSRDERLTSTYKLQISTSDHKDNDSQALLNILNQLITDYPENIYQKEILILGRYSFDVNRIIRDNNNFNLNKNYPLEDGRQIDKIIYAENKRLSIHFMTVHKAKGLEADIVILINCNAGKYGFPTELSDDKLLDLLLSDSDKFPNGEERRLFYVAMTRPKEKLFLIADQYNFSKFYKELDQNLESDEDLFCPYCVKGLLIERQGTTATGTHWIAKGCSNFSFGCDYWQFQ